MLRVIRPEAGEEPSGFFDQTHSFWIDVPPRGDRVENTEGHQFEGRLKPPFSSSRSVTSPNPNQEKNRGIFIKLQNYYTVRISHATVFSSKTDPV
jgi:hypothetical protein